MAKITKIHSFLSLKILFWLTNILLNEKIQPDASMNLIKTDTCVCVCVYVSMYVSVCVAPVD